MSGTTPDEDPTSQRDGTALLNTAEAAATKAQTFWLKASIETASPGGPAHGGSGKVERGGYTGEESEC